MPRLIVGMTGASGAALGVRLLEALRQLPDVETHLVMSRWARTTIELETPYTAGEVAKLANVTTGPVIRPRRSLPARFRPTAWSSCRAR